MDLSRKTLQRGEIRRERARRSRYSPRSTRFVRLRRGRGNHRRSAFDRGKFGAALRPDKNRRNLQHGRGYYKAAFAYVRSGTQKKQKNLICLRAAFSREKAARFYF